MNPEPLAKMGRWRGVEGAIEITVPLTLMGVVWYIMYGLFSAPTAGRSLTTLEVWAIIGVAVAMTSWAISRQFYLGRKRRPRTLLIGAGFTSLLLAWIVASQVQSAFQATCETDFLGEVITLTSIEHDSSAAVGEGDGEGAIVCRVGGVADNPYLIGSVMRPSWDGRLTPPMIAFMLIVSVLTVLGFRSTRVRPTQLSFKLNNLLRFAPSAGSESAMGEVNVKAGKIVACSNATLWGETCGQIYSSEKNWYDGEWCQRCQQAFVPSQRRFTFRVVSLLTGEVDVLNGLERIDTVSWPRGEPMIPDGRPSGEERWVTLGTIELPEVITVAQALAIVHELLPGWADSDKPRIKVAGKNAVTRASRVAAWIWRGQLAHRLTYARPTSDAILALGPQRLRDLVEDSSEELWLQLDVGLVPMEVRTGFRKTFLEEGRAPELQNSKFDLWIPVAAPLSKSAAGGVWVPRIEGTALRAWLSLDQLRDESLKGVSIPLPYLRYDPQNRGRPPEGHDRAPKPGTLDFVRYPLDGGGREPVIERAIGASMAEWDWFEWRQIELLRQECLVLEVAADA